MKYDLNRSLSFTKDEIRLMLAQIFGLTTHEQEEFLAKAFSGDQVIKYEDFIREAVLFYICDVYFRGEHKDLISFKG